MKYRNLAVTAALGIALAAGIPLAGCDSAETDAQGSAPAQQERTQELEQPSAETKTAEAGDPVTYESASGNGEFIVTVEGFERSAEVTDNYRTYGDVADGYSVCLLLLKIEDVSAEMNPGESTTLTKMWLEGPDGVTMNPMSSAYNYGEYAAAASGYFPILVGQTVRIAIPYQVPDGQQSFTVVIDGTEVPVSLTEGSRGIG